MSPPVVFLVEDLDRPAEHAGFSLFSDFERTGVQGAWNRRVERRVRKRRFSRPVLARTGPGRVDEAAAAKLRID